MGELNIINNKTPHITCMPFKFIYIVNNNAIFITNNFHIIKNLYYILENNYTKCLIKLSFYNFMYRSIGESPCQVPVQLIPLYPSLLIAIYI